MIGLRYGVSIPLTKSWIFPLMRPGEIIDSIDGKLIVRTVDGSLLIEEYECGRRLLPGDRLE